MTSGCGRREAGLLRARWRSGGVVRKGARVRSRSTRDAVDQGRNALRRGRIARIGVSEKQRSGTRSAPIGQLREPHRQALVCLSGPGHEPSVLTERSDRRDTNRSVIAGESRRQPEQDEKKRRAALRHESGVRDIGIPKATAWAAERTLLPDSQRAHSSRCDECPFPQAFPP